MWLLYLGVTIIASYPLPDETSYFRSVRNSLIILLDHLKWRWDIRSTNMQLIVETWTQVLRLANSVSYQLGHPNVGGGGGVTLTYMVFNSLSLHKSRKLNLNVKQKLFILSEVERIPFQKEEEKKKTKSKGTFWYCFLGWILKQHKCINYCKNPRIKKHTNATIIYLLEWHLSPTM